MEKRKWYYLPDKIWFENRKQVKDYLGGTNKFNKELSVRNVIYVESK